METVKAQISKNADMVQKKSLFAFQGTKKVAILASHFCFLTSMILHE